MPEPKMLPSISVTLFYEARLIILVKVQYTVL